MSSSTSSSDAPGWRGFTAVLVAVAAALTVAILGTAYLIDPYDTGRSTLFEKPGVRPQGPRTAAASRGRDPAFDGAIIGNSHIQLLSPERLKEKTGISFVQLSVPATGPKEQLTLIDWYLRHRREPPKALLISADYNWCKQDPALANEKPFPFWLYSGNALEYAGGLLRFDILEELPRRFGYVFGRKAERAPADGYWDYEPEYLGLGYGTNPVLRARLDQNRGTAGIVHRGPFPAAERLAELAADLPATTALILVHSPIYAPSLAPPGTPAYQGDLACKAALRQAASRHPRFAVVDWRVDRPETRDPNLFFDTTHYRLPLARAVEEDVAAALRGLR